MSANAAMRMWLVRGADDVHEALKNLDEDEEACAARYKTRGDTTVSEGKTLIGPFAPALTHQVFSTSERIFGHADVRGARWPAAV